MSVLDVTRDSCKYLSCWRRQQLKTNLTESPICESTVRKPQWNNTEGGFFSMFVLPSVQASVRAVTVHDWAIGRQNSCSKEGCASALLDAPLVDKAWQSAPIVAPPVDIIWIYTTTYTPHIHVVPFLFYFCLPQTSWVCLWTMDRLKACV